MDVVAYTFEREPSSLDEGDRVPPPKLAAAAGYEHRVIPMQAYEAEAAATFDEHTAFHSDDLDRECVGFGQWELIPPQALVLGGNLFELGRCYYHTRQPETPPEWFEGLGRRRAKSTGEIGPIWSNALPGGWRPLSKDSTRQDVNVCTSQTTPSCLLSSSRFPKIYAGRRSPA
jgi:hypothetical protein